MKPAFLVIGNVWLMAALVMVLGKIDLGSGDICSFFNIGGWHYLASYNLMIGLCVCLALFHFALLLISGITSEEEKR